MASTLPHTELRKGSLPVFLPLHFSARNTGRDQGFKELTALAGDKSSQSWVL